MLELTTKRPSMQLKVDGETVDVPLSFTAHEMVRLGKAEDKEDAMFSYFAEYIPGFDQLGDDAVRAVLEEWTRLRREIGEPELGE